MLPMGNTARVRYYHFYYATQKQPIGRLIDSDNYFYFHVNIPPLSPDVDECEINNGGCGEKECRNTVGSYYCGCNPGYRLDTTSQRCVDKDECEVGVDVSHLLPRQQNPECRGEVRHLVCLFVCLFVCQFVCLFTCLFVCLFGNTGGSLFGLIIGIQSLITEPGPLDSPRYPRNYPPNTTCSWLIQAHPNTRIDITFLFFDLEAVTNCRYDSLTIYDGERESSGRLEKMCNRLDHAVTYRSTGSSMLLKFKSDLVLSKRGFHAVVDMVSDRCGGKYFTLAVSSLYWTFSSPRRLTLWQIEAAEGRYILINFMKFKMSDSRRSSRDDSGEGCSPDEALEIYSTKDSEFLARFCYNQRPPKLYHIYRSSITIIGRGRFRSSNMDILMLHSSTSQYKSLK
eukprot:sb/3465415/